ncbi:MAG: LysR family transcriptional regulator [Faecalispora jeddahensis]
MDIKQLTYFMAVAQEGSYSKAAEKLSISQPTLSIAVKSWRRNLVSPSSIPSTAGRSSRTAVSA